MHPDDAPVPDATGATAPCSDFVGEVDGRGVKAVMVSPKEGVQMIDPDFLLGIGGVLTYGARKYAKNNWMRGMDWAEPIGSVFRHFCRWLMGERLDPESGLSHLHHVAVNIMFLAYYDRREEHQQFDGRVFKTKR